MALFQAAKDDSSGGVTNFINLPRIRFANRIRNAAIGGLEYNKRFIVITTETENLSSGTYAKGL
jgi:hypothetical protein